MRPIVFENEHFYHIYNRGVDYRHTFLTESDRWKFIHKLDASRFRMDEQLVEIIAFVMMPNHFHLILQQCVAGGISRFMQKLGTSYTQYFNRKYERTGCLFGSTFHAKFIHDTNYLTYLSRYIHRNPIEIFGGITQAFMSYRWSSFLTYLDLDRLLFVKKELVMNCFDSRAEYEDFVLADDED